MARHRGLNLAGVEVYVITAPVLRLDRDRDRVALGDNQAGPWPRLLLRSLGVRLHGHRREQRRRGGRVAGVLSFVTAAARLCRSCWCITRERMPRGSRRGSRTAAAPVTSMPSATRTCDRCAEPGNTWCSPASNRAAPASAAFIHLELVGTNFGDDPPGGHRGNSRTASDAISRSKCPVFFAPGRGGHASEAPRASWRSRTSRLGRAGVARVEPARFAAGPLAGNVWTDRPRWVVPVPHKERGNGNGPSVCQAAVAPSSEEQSCQA